MPRYISKQEQFGHLWWAEIERYVCDPRDYYTLECAELADELAHHEAMAIADPVFDEHFDEWRNFAYEHQLMLPLEQSCYQGVLLPTGQRARRLESCPEDLMRSLRWFFELCPAHVKSYVALDSYLLIRIYRGRRTGNPDWRPSTAVPAPETDRAFFRPPVLKTRNYAR